MSAGQRAAAPSSPDRDSARTTTNVLRLLREHRRAALRRNRGDAAYAVYLTVFVGVLALPPAAIAVFEAVSAPSPLDPWSADRSAALVPLLLTGLLWLLWVSAREAAVRGPVQVSAPLIDWVLPLPVDRSRFLAPALLRSVAVRAASGAALGPLLLVLLWRTVLPVPGSGGGGAWVLLAQTGLAGALVGVLSTACGALVVAYGTRATRALRLWHALAQLLLLGSAGIAWTLALPAPSLRAGAWIGLVLLAVGAAWLFVLALRSLRVVEPSSLRERAATASGLRSGIWMSDPSWYQVAVTERVDRADQDIATARPLVGTARPGSQVTGVSAGNTRVTRFRPWSRTWFSSGFSSRQGSGPRLRLRPPRDARYLVPWRDLLGVLRAPYPALRGFLMVWVALVLVRTDAHLEGAAAFGWLLAPAVLLYLAAAQLLSGARMDVADPRRVRYLPPTQSFGTLALMHGVLPLVCLFTAVGAAVPLLLLSGAPASDAGSLLLALPATVAGALVGVYRGWMPDHLTVGVETPMGNTAPLQMAAWHLSGLLGLLVAIAPVVLGVGLGPGAVLGQWWLDVLWVVLGTSWLVSWARRRARASLSA